MNRTSLMQSLHAHAMKGWCRADAAALPAVDGRRRMLWCGIGGSLLPSETMLKAFGSPEQGCRWVSLASPEPLPLVLDPADQLVFASKSGKTLELWTWISRLRTQKAWGAWEQPPIAVTQDDGNPLAAFARAEGWPIAPIPADVGGRFSAFTPIGTLPLAWAGRDPEAFLRGGREVSGQLEAGAGPWHDQVWRFVEILLEGYLKGVCEWVLMPYVQRLEFLSAWWVQLVAESLGKDTSDGFHRGLTPIRAVGPVDQHSQLQRWMAGPRNLGVIVVTKGADAGEDRLSPPPGCPYPHLAELTGQRILEAQSEGTLEALEGVGVPVHRWHLSDLTEYELGTFMMSWQWIVGLLGLALEIDPFDQPAVEGGKQRTFAKLGL